MRGRLYLPTNMPLKPSPIESGYNVPDILPRRVIPLPDVSRSRDVHVSVTGGVAETLNVRLHGNRKLTHFCYELLTLKRVLIEPYIASF